MSQSQQVLTKSALRVRRQLAEAILFEQLIPYDEEMHFDENEIRYRLYGKNYTFLCIGKRTVFDRIRLHDDIYLLGEDGLLHEAAIEQLVCELTDDAHVKYELIRELQQTIRLSDWTEKHIHFPKSRRALSYEQLESAITEGHPYHPCYKARIGFSIFDHQSFGPEGRQSFKLHWIAIKRRDVHVFFPQEEDVFWEQEVGASTLKALMQALLEKGGSLKEYTLLPIHPWQWEALREIGLNELIKRKDILPLGSYGDDYSATQSVRTLWNASNPKKAHVKLSMNMMNTSSLRTLPPHTTCAAPAISSWLHSVVASDSLLQTECRLVLLKEYASITFEREDYPELNGQIGAIWRESVHRYLDKGEKAVPFTALMMLEKDGRLFLDEWLSEYGMERWVRRFLEVTVLPVWHLVVAHGIGVEAHAQNMILLHKNGWPTRVVLRDFHESVEYTKDFVTRPEWIPSFEHIHPRFKQGPVDQYYWMSTIEALRELVMDTLFVFHLSEISYALERYAGFHEQKFWALVREVIEEYIDRFPHLKERHAMLDSYQPKIFVESLLRNKIQRMAHGHHRHTVTNTLATEL